MKRKNISSNKKIIFILIIIIISVGIFVRIWGLNKESYWIDEAISVSYVNQSYLKTFYLIQQDIHPPLHISMLYVWVKLFGTSPNATRSLSVIFGVLSVGIAFLLGRKLLNDEIGIICAIFVALSPLMIYYSQETRAYSLLVFLALLSFYFFIQFIDKPNISNSIIYILVTVLLLYTHVFAVLVVLVQNVFYAYLKRIEIKKIFSRKGITNLKNWIIIQIILILIFLPWILIILKQMKNSYYTSWIPIPGAILLTSSLKEFFGNFLIVIIFCILTIYLVINHFYPKTFNFLRRKENLELNELNYPNKIINKDILIMLLIWIILPFVIVLTYSWIFHPFYQTRYLLFTLPAVYLLFSWMIAKLTKNKFIKYALLAIIIISSSVSIFAQERDLQKDDWKGITAYLNMNVKTSDIIFIHPYYHQSVFAYYYEKSCFGAYDDYGCMSNKNVLSINWKESCCNDTTTLTSRTSKNYLEDYINKEIWLVSVRPEITYGNDNLYKYLSEHKKLISTKEFSHDIKIYKFE